MWCLLGTNCFSRLTTVRVPITDSRILSYRPRIGTAASATTTATGNRKRLRARSPFRPVVQRLGNTGDFYPTVRPSLNLRHSPEMLPKRSPMRTTIHRVSIGIVDRGFVVDEFNDTWTSERSCLWVKFESKQSFERRGERSQEGIRIDIKNQIERNRNKKTQSMFGEKRDMNHSDDIHRCDIRPDRPSDALWCTCR